MLLTDVVGGEEIVCEIYVGRERAGKLVKVLRQHVRVCNLKTNTTEDHRSNVWPFHSCPFLTNRFSSPTMAQSDDDDHEMDRSEDEENEFPSWLADIFEHDDKNGIIYHPGSNSMSFIRRVIQNSTKPTLVLQRRLLPWHQKFAVAANTLLAKRHAEPGGFE